MKNKMWITITQNYSIVLNWDATDFCASAFLVECARVESVPGWRVARTLMLRSWDIPCASALEEIIREAF